MKVFLINLDRDVERLAAADRQLLGLGIKYERIPAVYGKGLSDKEKHAHVNYFRWWCAVGIPPRDGQIGCALSHIEAYRRIVHNDISCACILEDDVVLDKRFTDVLAKVAEQIDTAKPQIMLLSNHSDETENSGGGDSLCGYLSANDRPFSIVPSTYDSFTEGYIINSAGAAALLEQNIPVIIYADAWKRWVRNGAISLFHVFPTVCSQNKGGFASHTILTDDKYNVSKMNAIAWLMHKCKRVIGCALDRLLVCITGK